MKNQETQITKTFEIEHHLEDVKVDTNMVNVDTSK